MGLAVVLIGWVASAEEPAPGQANAQIQVIELKAKKANLGPGVKRSEQTRTGETETVFVGIQNTCHVDSRVNAYIKVYINGEYRGTIPPYGDIYPFVGDDPDDVTTLYAVSTCGRYTWGPRDVCASYGNYHWILRP
jgi:hypothetical protein